MLSTDVLYLYVITLRDGKHKIYVGETSSNKRCKNTRSRYLYVITLRDGKYEIYVGVTSSIKRYKNTRSKLSKCCANIYFNRQWLVALTKKYTIFFIGIKCCVIDWRVVFICYNTSGWKT